MIARAFNSLSLAYGDITGMEVTGRRLLERSAGCSDILFCMTKRGEWQPISAFDIAECKAHALSAAVRGGRDRITPTEMAEMFNAQRLRMPDQAGADVPAMTPERAGRILSRALYQPFRSGGRRFYRIS